MSDKTQIYVRGALKLAAGALAMKAGLDATDSATLLSVIEGIVSAVSAAVGFYMSHRKLAQKA